MAYNSAKQELTIDNGLSLSEVSKCIGLSKRDLGRLCKSLNVNPFARYKPVPYKSWDVTKVNTPRFYRGKNSNCGLPLVLWDNTTLHKSGTALETFVNSAKTTQVSWDKANRIVPSGTAEEPYRLRDFDGYKHNADCPIYPVYSIGEIYYDTSTNKVVDAIYGIDANTDDTNKILTVNDISAFWGGNPESKTGINAYKSTKGCLGVLIYVKSSSVSAWNSSLLMVSKPAGDGYHGLDIPLSTMHAPGGSTAKLQANDTITFIPVITNINTQELSTSLTGVQSGGIIDVSAFNDIRCIPFPIEAGVPETVTIKQRASKKIYVIFELVDQSVNSFPAQSAQRIAFNARIEIPKGDMEYYGITSAAGFPHLDITHYKRDWDNNTSPMGQQGDLVTTTVFDQVILSGLTMQEKTVQVGSVQETRKYIETTVYLGVRDFFTGTPRNPYPVDFNAVVSNYPHNMTEASVEKQLQSILITK